MAIAVNNTTEVEETGSGGSTTLSHTVSSDDNRVLIVVIHTNGGTVSGVTYDGVSMTLEASVQASPDAIWCYIYSLGSPSTGANNIVVSHDDPTNIVVGGIDFTGADSSNPVGGTNTASDLTSQTSLSTTVTVEADAGIVVDVIRTQNPLTVGSGQTRFVTQDSFNGNRSAGASHEAHSGSNVTMSWTFSSSNINIMAAAEVQEFVESSFVPSMTIF